MFPSIPNATLFAIKYLLFLLLIFTSLKALMRCFEALFICLP